MNPETLPPNNSPAESVELVVDFSTRDLDVLSGPPTAKQLRMSVTRVKLMRLAQRGLKANEAAKALGISKDQALHHYRDPDFQREVMGRVSTVFGELDTEFQSKALTLREKIAVQAERSFDTLVKLLDEDKLTTQLAVKVHQDFLNRCEDTQPKTLVSHQTVDPEQLAIASIAAQEMQATMQGKVVKFPVKESA